MHAPLERLASHEHTSQRTLVLPIGGILSLVAASETLFDPFLVFEPTDKSLEATHIRLGGPCVVWVACPLIVIIGVGSGLQLPLILELRSASASQDSDFAMEVKNSRSVSGFRSVMRSPTSEQHDKIILAVIRSRFHVLQPHLMLHTHALSNWCQNVLQCEVVWKAGTLGSNSVGSAASFQKEWPSLPWQGCSEEDSHTEPSHPRSFALGQGATTGCLVVTHLGLSWCGLSLTGLDHIALLAFATTGPQLGWVIRDVSVAEGSMRIVAHLNDASQPVGCGLLDTIEFTSSGVSNLCVDWLQRQAVAGAARALGVRSPITNHSEPRSRSGAEHRLLSATRNVLSRFPLHARGEVLQWILFTAHLSTRELLAGNMAEILASGRDPAWLSHHLQKWASPGTITDGLVSLAVSDVSSGSGWQMLRRYRLVAQHATRVRILGIPGVVAAFVTQVSHSLVADRRNSSPVRLQLATFSRSSALEMPGDGSVGAGPSPLEEGGDNESDPPMHEAEVEAEDVAGDVEASNGQIDAAPMGRCLPHLPALAAIPPPLEGYTQLLSAYPIRPLAEALNLAGLQQAAWSICGVIVRCAHAA